MEDRGLSNFDGVDPAERINVKDGTLRVEALGVRGCTNHRVFKCDYVSLQTHDGNRRALYLLQC